MQQIREIISSIQHDIILSIFIFILCFSVETFNFELELRKKRGLGLTKAFNTAVMYSRPKS